MHDLSVGGQIAESGLNEAVCQKAVLTLDVRGLLLHRRIAFG
jgi:hypothetical protein